MQLVFQFVNSRNDTVIIVCMVVASKIPYSLEQDTKSKQNEYSSV